MLMLTGLIHGRSRFFIVMEILLVSFGISSYGGSKEDKLLANPSAICEKHEIDVADRLRTMGAYAYADMAHS